MSTNNIYYVDMKKRFEKFQNNEIDMHNLHELVCYENIMDWNIYVIGLHNYVRGMNRFNLDFGKLGWRIYKKFYNTMEGKTTYTANQEIKNNSMNGKYRSCSGKSYLSGNFVPVEEYHCHHKTPRSKNGKDTFINLCVLSVEEHRILHGKTPEKLLTMTNKKFHKRVKDLIDLVA